MLCISKTSMQYSQLQIANISKLFALFVFLIMSEVRKNEVLAEFRRPTGNKSSRSRDLKACIHHFRSKDTFVTDTQSTDYTKSSGSIKTPGIQQLQQTISKLQNEILELKQRIVDLKANQCFQISEQKLRSVIRQNDQLRKELEKSRSNLERSLVERDFFQRFNKNLKIQCQSLTKEIMSLKASASLNDPIKVYKSSQGSRQNSSSKNVSNEIRMSSKKSQLLNCRKEKQQKGKERFKSIKGCLSASRLHPDYYGERVIGPNKNN